MKSPEELQVEVAEEQLDEVDVTQLDKREIPVHSQQEDDFLKGKIADILGHDIKEVPKYDTELERILEWARMKGAKSVEDILWEVRYLATRLGTPGIGESRIKWIYQYVFLENEDHIIKQQMKRMEGLASGK
jgi:hypothetical protein